MPDYLGEDQRRVKDDNGKEKPFQALDESDIALLKTYVILL
jgi:26S proteasome regulatory subunit T1